MIKVEYINLNTIEVADVNPKDHDIGDIYTSIKRFGFTEPIIKNEATGKLVAGLGVLLSKIAIFLSFIGIKLKGRSWSPGLLFIAKKHS